MAVITRIPCSSGNMTYSRQGMAIDTIVAHYTASMASARNNGIYFSRPGAQASAHYFIDGGDEIILSVDEANTAWHASVWSINCRSIGIEVVSDGRDYSAAEIAQLTWLINDLQKRYGIPDSRVIRHYDCNGKHCPLPYVNAQKWQTLKSTILKGAQPMKPVQKPGKAKNELNIVTEGHVANLGNAGRVRDGQVCGTEGYGAGLEQVEFDLTDTGLKGELEIEFTWNIENVGQKSYRVAKGKKTKCGTTGKGQALEGAAFRMVKNTTGRKFYVQFHRANKGWDTSPTEITSAIKFRGSEGMHNQIEAMRFWAE